MAREIRIRVTHHASGAVSFGFGVRNPGYDPRGLYVEPSYSLTARATADTRLSPEETARQTTNALASQIRQWVDAEGHPLFQGVEADGGLLVLRTSSPWAHFAATGVSGAGIEFA